MPRSSIWDGSQWVSMTGGSGEGGSEPDNTYLRLDSANNPITPNNFLRTVDADLLYFPIDGSDIFGDLRLIDDTPSMFFLAPNEITGYRVFGNVSNVTDLGLSFRTAAGAVMFKMNDPVGINASAYPLFVSVPSPLADMRVRNGLISDTPPSGQLGDLWYDTSPRADYSPTVELRSTRR